ncbi:MAG TPA: enoyl-CoA hydratase-related protein [Polyangia bacterium]|nr:enoyl-CoA hydratase-related protein [Polyangia bacterium]
MSTVKVERDGRIAWLTLERPEAANALSKALVADLDATLQAFSHEDEPLPVLVVTGAGEKAFCAGADLKERRAMSLDETRAFLRELNATVDALASYPQPVIAALNGAAYGGGLELALACDIRIAAQGIELGLPEVRLGILPGAGGTQRLSRLCGLATAKELILTGRRIDAARAQALGLVSAVVPPAELRAEALRWATELATAGPLAVAQAKSAIDAGFGEPLEQGLAMEREAYEIVLGSEDRNEGLRAFAEKRKPNFTGK